MTDYQYDAYDSWNRTGYEDGLNGIDGPTFAVPPEYLDSYRDGHKDGAFKRQCDQEDAAE